MEIYSMIFDLLSETFETFAPKTHKGDCTTNYVVLKDAGTQPLDGKSSTITYYDILCYSKNFTEVLQMVSEIKEKMKKLQFSVMPTHNETQPYFDDDVKAYMCSVEYRCYRKYYN